MGILRRILMCPPKYFTVAYEINPWMSVTIQANNQRAHQQWENLHSTLSKKCGALVESIEPVDGLPDMVFTANAGLVYKKKIYLSQFKYPERQGERAYFDRWFRTRHFDVTGDDECSFEGAGDALFAGNKLFAAHGFRTDVKVYSYVLQKFSADHQIEAADRSDENGNMIVDRMRMTADGGSIRSAGVSSSSKRMITTSNNDRKNNSSLVHLITCELVDPRFYHIDTCFCPITPQLAIWNPKAFSEDSRKRMQNEIELIAVPEREADRFACNSVVVGKHVVLPAQCEETGRTLEKRGFETHSVDVSEFLKAGGACKCLILDLTQGLDETKSSEDNVWK